MILLTLNSKAVCFFVIAKWFKLFKRSFKGAEFVLRQLRGETKQLWSESQQLKMRLLGFRCKMGLWLQAVVPAGADVVRGEDYKKLRTELAWRMKVISRRKGADPKSKSYQKCQKLGTFWPLHYIWNESITAWRSVVVGIKHSWMGGAWGWKSMT